jgi:hypothetical protein
LKAGGRTSRLSRMVGCEFTGRLRADIAVSLRHGVVGNERCQDGFVAPHPFRRRPEKSGTPGAWLVE